jgi:ferric-chelate reductase
VATLMVSCNERLLMVSCVRRAGQHVKLRVFFTPALEHAGSRFYHLFSSFRCLEAHPFSISAAPRDDSVSNQRSGFPLYVSSLARGSWTHDLYQFAGDASNVNRRVRVLLDGPYGGPGLMQPCESESVLLVAAGSGISYVAGLADEIVGRVVKGARGAHTKVLELVWVIPDPGKCHFTVHIEHRASVCVLMPCVP